LWPFATLGWPDSTKDLARFYPTHFLSTAREIIYLWVARMIMAGYEFMDELPVEKRCAFSVCNVHATVLDAKGKRMSKSAGNGVDPIDMIEKYGADAMRFALMMLTREGQDVRFAENRLEDARRFTNKIWNAARFVLMQMGGERTGGTSKEAQTLEDRWILSRLAETIEGVTAELDGYRFNDAATRVYRFVWNDFCDWYVELVKSRLAGDDDSARAARGTLARVLADILALLHPFTPFQSEVLWDALHAALGTRAPAMLVRTDWPKGAGLARDAAAEREMELVQSVVRAVRNVRAMTTIGDRKPLPAIATSARGDELAVLEHSRARIAALANLSSLEIGRDLARPKGSAAAVAGTLQVFVPLGGEVDTAALRETLLRRVEKLDGGILALEKKLANEGFVANAEPDLIEAERARLAEQREERELLATNAAGL
jgi:valyl-tRNA synthetase